MRSKIKASLFILVFGLIIQVYAQIKNDVPVNIPAADVAELKTSDSKTTTAAEEAEAIKTKCLTIGCKVKEAYELAQNLKKTTTGMDAIANPLTIPLVEIESNNEVKSITKEPFTATAETARNCSTDFFWIFKNPFLFDDSASTTIEKFTSTPMNYAGKITTPAMDYSTDDIEERFTTRQNEKTLLPPIIIGPTPGDVVSERASSSIILTTTSFFLKSDTTFPQKTITIIPSIIFTEKNDGTTGAMKDQTMDEEKRTTIGNDNSPKSSSIAQSLGRILTITNPIEQTTKAGDDAETIKVQTNNLFQTTPLVSKQTSDTEPFYDEDFTVYYANTTMLPSSEGNTQSVRMSKMDESSTTFIGETTKVSTNSETEASTSNGLYMTEFGSLLTNTNSKTANTNPEMTTTKFESATGINYESSGSDVSKIATKQVSSYSTKEATTETSSVDDTSEISEVTSSFPMSPSPKWGTTLFEDKTATVVGNNRESASTKAVTEREFTLTSKTSIFKNGATTTVFKNSPNTLFPSLATTMDDEKATTTTGNYEFSAFTKPSSVSGITLTSGTSNFENGEFTTIVKNNGNFLFSSQSTVVNGAKETSLGVSQVSNNQDNFQTNTMGQFATTLKESVTVIGNEKTTEIGNSRSTTDGSEKFKTTITMSGSDNKITKMTENSVNDIPITKIPSSQSIGTSNSYFGTKRLIITTGSNANDIPITKISASQSMNTEGLSFDTITSIFTAGSNRYDGTKSIETTPISQLNPLSASPATAVLIINSTSNSSDNQNLSTLLPFTQSSNNYEDYQTASKKLERTTLVANETKSSTISKGISIQAFLTTKMPLQDITFMTNSGGIGGIGGGGADDNYGGTEGAKTSTLPDATILASNEQKTVTIMFPFQTTTNSINSGGIGGGGGNGGATNSTTKMSSIPILTTVNTLNVTMTTRTTKMPLNSSAMPTMSILSNATNLTTEESYNNATVASSTKALSNPVVTSVFLNNSTTTTTLSSITPFTNVNTTKNSLNSTATTIFSNNSTATDTTESEITNHSNIPSLINATTSSTTKIHSNSTATPFLTNNFTVTLVSTSINLTTMNANATTMNTPSISFNLTSTSIFFNNSTTVSPPITILTTVTPSTNSSVISTGEIFLNSTATPMLLNNLTTAVTSSAITNHTTITTLINATMSSATKNPLNSISTSILLNNFTTTSMPISVNQTTIIPSTNTTAKSTKNNSSNSIPASTMPINATTSTTPIITNLTKLTLSTNDSIMSSTSSILNLTRIMSAGPTTKWSNATTTTPSIFLPNTTQISTMKNTFNSSVTIPLNTLSTTPKFPGNMNITNSLSNATLSTIVKSSSSPSLTTSRTTTFNNSTTAILSSTRNGRTISFSNNSTVTSSMKTLPITIFSSNATTKSMNVTNITNSFTNSTSVITIKSSPGPSLPTQKMTISAHSTTPFSNNSSGTTVSYFNNSTITSTMKSFSNLFATISMSIVKNNSTTKWLNATTATHMTSLANSTSISTIKTTFNSSVAISVNTLSNSITTKLVANGSTINPSNNATFASTVKPSSISATNLSSATSPPAANSSSNATVTIIRRSSFSFSTMITPNITNYSTTKTTKVAETASTNSSSTKTSTNSALPTVKTTTVAPTLFCSLFSIDSVTSSYDQTYSNEIPVNSKVTVICKQGYIFNDLSSIRIFKCMQNLTWVDNPEIEICQKTATKCLVPSLNLSNAASPKSSALNQASEVGTQIIHLCEASFTFASGQPLNVYQCLGNGTWSSSISQNNSCQKL